MKKIAIVTLNGYFNYGNRLQNYALQESIKDFDFSVETLVNMQEEKKGAKPTFTERFKNLVNNNPAEIIDKIESKIINKKYKDEFNKSEEVRTNIFKQFTYHNIAEAKSLVPNNTNSKEFSSKYDYFITGSDQVWNPSMNRMSSFFFLDFAEEDKRLSYAASFGISEIPEEYKEDYKKWLSGMHKLSVREDDGSKIIKDLTGRDAPVHVDPTLLLTKEKWMTIAKEASNKPKEKYLLTYFLGGVPKEYKKQIDKIVKEKNLEVINLGDIREKETYRTGPSEFIDYIKDCSIFCTDSFHGAIFSIIFEKPFIVYERMGSSMSMYSRMETLLSKFKLEDRKFENIKNTEEAFDIDYSHVPAILEEERKKSFDYLKDALNVENRD